MDWNNKKSEALYGMHNWGNGYFNINNDGNVEVCSFCENHKPLDLKILVDNLNERGICAPVLLRFPDIVNHRVSHMVDCFNKAIKDSDYQGQYSKVYPIKVNQQSHLVDDVVASGYKHGMGLECGSKPELLVTLAMMDNNKAIIICNGFKDEEYIETALLARKLGKQTYIVVDRKDELPMIIKASKKLGIKPLIGLRTKLNTKGAGKWVESSGARSKFGLTPSEIIEAVQLLKDADLLSQLRLLHFHIGSQVPSIQSIKESLKEAVRVYTELHQLGAPLTHIDVGGGLGVDYDGSNGETDHSRNYSDQAYANDVVHTIATLCNEKNIPHPTIVSECGRALVAHSSLLIFNVLGKNTVRKSKLPETPKETDHKIVKQIYDIYDNLDKYKLNESYNDLKSKHKDIIQMFSYGVLSLEQRAKAEDLFWTTATKIAEKAKNSEEDKEIFSILEQFLSDTYFCNFSIFQSLPDAWAVGQIFPIMPIHRHNEMPSQRATLVDLTCDSDGKLTDFIDSDTNGIQNYLEVHSLNEDEPYYLGAFLAGAYQETLGDLHNLFGDTNAVHITLTEKGYEISHVVEGDSVEEVLSYVEYDKKYLIEKIRKSCEESINAETLTRQDARMMMQHYQDSLAGYTYLE